MMQLDQQKFLCRKCGIPIQSDETICDSCRNKEITLTKMHEFYEQIKDIEIAINRLSNYNMEVKRLQNAKYSSSEIWLLSLLLIAPASEFVIFIIYGTVCEMVETVELTWFVTITLGIGLLAIIVFIVSGVILPIIWSKRNRTKFYNKIRQQIEYYNRLIAQENKFIADVYSQSNQYISMSYANPSIVRILIKLIESNRADSLKEAINLYESIKHTNMMLQLQQEIVHDVRYNSYINTVSAMANVATAYNTHRR